MLIVLNKQCSDAERAAVVEAIRARDLEPLEVPGRLRTAICVTGNAGALDPAPFIELPGVLEVMRVTKPYKLVSREVHPEDTVVELGDVQLGGDAPPVIVGRLPS